MDVVIGLGKTGLSCVRYLLAQGRVVSVMDTRVAPPNLAICQDEFPSVSIKTGPLDANVLCQAARIILSPGVSPAEPAIQAAVAAGVPCLGDVALFAELALAPIIAITGTNGKTTTTSLVGHVLAAAGKSVVIGGNIGTPVLDLLSEPVPDYDVLELSSFQLETTPQLNADTAVILNLSSDHMDRYETERDYLQAKQRIYHGCRRAVINADEPNLWASLTLPNAVVRFSIEGASSADYVIQDGTIHTPAGTYTLSAVNGQNHVHPQNIVVTLAIAAGLSLTEPVVIEAIQRFQSLPHRCQWVASIKAVDWYNDSKATNAGSVIAALHQLGPRYTSIVLIAGGDAKGGDLRVCRDMFNQHVRHLILIGQDADQFVALFGDELPYTKCASLSEAVAQAAQLATAGEAVLLSPACASWDMFKDYEDRGEQFMETVYAYQREQQA